MIIMQEHSLALHGHLELSTPHMLATALRCELNRYGYMHTVLVNAGVVNSPVFVLAVITLLGFVVTYNVSFYLSVGVCACACVCVCVDLVWFGFLTGSATGLKTADNGTKVWSLHDRYFFPIMLCLSVCLSVCLSGGDVVCILIPLQVLHV